MVWLAVVSKPQHPESESRSPTGDQVSRDRHGLRPGLDGLRDLMDRLLSEQGCPWDREQSLDTLRPYLIEEAYEVLEVMDDPPNHRKELGDLLFQIVFQSALREREGAFSLDDVIAAIREKMVRRHPHVFGEQATTNLSADEVAKQWAELKAQERAGEDRPARPLAGVPKALPALQRAWRLQNKAAGVGFDWPDEQGPLAKFQEEWQEFEEARAAGDAQAMHEEFGDLLFVLVRLGQKLGITAEDALRATNRKFESRFAHVMNRCHAEGIDPASAGLERLDGYWDEAKKLARGE